MTHPESHPCQQPQHPRMCPISSKSYPVESSPSKNKVTLPILTLRFSGSAKARKHILHWREKAAGPRGRWEEAGQMKAVDSEWVWEGKSSWDAFEVPGTQELCLSLRVSLCPVEDTVASLPPTSRADSLRVWKYIPVFLAARCQGFKALLIM